MSSVSFTYAGKRKKIKVPESFWALSEAEKSDFLDGVMRQKDRPKPSGGTGSALLDTLSLLERPAQALKVGIRETGIGGYDPTPEGFLAGLGKGWRGEDTVRTQEFMSKHFRTEHPWLAGIGGFVGDVLTDPLTYVGAGAVKLMGKGLTSAYGVLPGSTALTSAVSKLPYTETAGIGRGIRGLGRAFNVPITAEEKAAKQAADIARAGGATSKPKPPPQFGMRVTDPRLEGHGQFITNESIRLNRMGAFREHSLFTPRELKKELKLLEKFFKKRSKDTGMDKSMLHTSFRDFMEKAIDENLEQVVVSDVFMGVLGQTGINLAKKWATYMHRAKSIENDFALRIPEFGRQMEVFGGPTGYFPKVATKEAKQYHQVGKEDIGGVGSLGYQQRFTHGTVHESNVEYKNLFGIEQTFYENPVVALGIRLDDHHKAIQKQWFVDQITDKHFASTWLRGQAGIPLLNLGRYVGKDKHNNPVVEAFGDFGTGASSWRSVHVTDKLYTNAYKAEEKLKGGAKPNPIEAEALRDKKILEHNGISSREALMKWRPVTGVRRRMGEGKTRPEDFDPGPGPKRDPRTGHWASKLKRPSWFEPEPAAEDIYRMSFHAPEDLGKAISNHLNIMGNHKGQIDDFLKFYDAVQNGWKGWSLAVRPAYHIRNVVGNMFNAYTIAGITNPAHFINAFKLQRAGSKGELATTTGFNGIRGESMESIAQSGQRNGVVGGQYTDDIRRTEEERILAKVGKGGLERTTRMFGQDNPMVALGFTAGEALESNARWGVYLAKLKSIRSNPSRHTWEAPDGTKIKLSNKGALAKWGIDPKEAGYQVAARDVKEALFDYGDISVFERNSMKRLMPFYTWTRKNIPAQIKHLVLNPQRAEKLHLAREQFEFAGGRPEFRDIAPFWGNRVPIFFGQETEGVRGLFTLLNTVPLADLERLHKPAELLADLASPILKQTLEQLSNYDMFRKRAIREYKGEKKDFMGVALPPWAWHLVQVLVPIAEINRLNPGGLFGEQTADPTTGMQTISPGFGGFAASRESGPVDIGAAARMVRFFTGGRAYDINIEQQRGFRALTLIKDLRRLKSMLKWAAAKGEERKVKEIYDLLEAVLNQEEEDPFLRRR